MYGYEDKTYNEVLTQAVNNIEEINQAVDAICEKVIRTFILWELVALMRWQAHYIISLRQIQQFRGIMKLQQN